jgi:hypothetical protein
LFQKCLRNGTGTFVTKNYGKEALVPDGRIFGQITQKRPQKIAHGRKKLEAVKWQNMAKSGKKRPENICTNI